ncbi:MAG: T9SS type B sorting domain-containing protein [Winogradskyella sp.]|uniref:T9SS type B sorting domain-containing protein n=1 Tax=Winogradskyella sp. TaxID=1883156 RepID=UPI001805213D|nr:T9SS type B sorting domain-containing protein [Winogradskyella sp.]MBT8245686.1 T9SS type B sorting domain-containing protein [Winogradskyella sp.]NNK23661.1 T9SS type B sorting domain-containing protein [Winogradskyella sp.]
MKIFKTAGVFILLLTNVLLGYGQNSPPTIVVIGDQNYCVGTNTPVATSVSITDPDVTDTTLETVSIQISQNYVLGADNLALLGLHPSINAVWDIVSGKLFLNAISGSASFAQFEAAILDVVFTTTQTVFTADRKISINLGSANFLPSTGHYYFYEPNINITWAQAKTAAESQNYFGLQGYLATLTSPEEAQLSGEQASGTGWIGATDESSEGTWRWVTGPEGLENFGAGRPFWQGTFTGGPVNGEYSKWNNGEPNQNGNEDYAHITDPSIGIAGSWNDLSNTGPPSGPYQAKGYMVEFGGMPGDPVINLSGATTLNMPQIQVVNVQGCEGEEFNLLVNTNVDEIIWYADAALTTVVNTGNTYTTTLNETTTYFIISRFSGCIDQQQRMLTVTVDALPEVVNLTIQQCDDASGDGVSAFELNAFSGAIANGNTTNVVTFFEDMALTIPINALSYINQVNNQVIYARVLNQTTNCDNIAEVTLSVSLPSNQVYNLEICDDEEEDGLTEFDLSLLNTEILMDLPVTAQISYFESFDDALLNDNPLGNTYTNQTPDYQAIFVKVTDGLECLGISEVNLTVNPLSELLPDETVFYCQNTFPETIILNGGIVNEVPNNFYYNWSTGETTIEIEVNEPGIYTVKVTEVDGCSNLRTITVLGSEIAVIDSIDVTDALENNVVTVNVLNHNSYEFSLNSESGPFQDSNIFNNVPSGIQTVYVRDKNGCGVVSESFPVIGFPKFFTPNGDANNDFWTINGFSEEFLANSRVQIFDRHGKLLTQLTTENPFWDGRYNGNPMPSDDYWFSVQLQDGRTFTKHFALKR